MSEQLEKVWDYIIGPELWRVVGGSAMKVILILIIALIAMRIGKKVINRLFDGSASKRSPHFTERREKTIKKLMQNAWNYVIWFIAIIMILQSGFSLPIGSLLAGAGVAGLAIGFGAQNLVRDILSGFFIIFEDQFSVGDYIYASEVEGTVEEIGIRTTKILSWTGELNVVPNGNITQVTNYSAHDGLSVVDINIPYESDINQAEKIIEEIILELPDRYDVFTGTPEIMGVQTLDLSHYVIRVIADTQPVFQWAGARVIRKEVKERLYHEGIDIPSPRLVMYSRGDDSEPLPTRQPEV